jgi:hypothetical protein
MLERTEFTLKPMRTETHRLLGHVVWLAGWGEARDPLLQASCSPRISEETEWHGPRSQLRTLNRDFFFFLAAVMGFVGRNIGNCRHLSLIY